LKKNLGLRNAGLIGWRRKEGDRDIGPAKAAIVGFR